MDMGFRGFVSMASPTKHRTRVRGLSKVFSLLFMFRLSVNILASTVTGKGQSITSRDTFRTRSMQK